MGFEHVQAGRLYKNGSDAQPLTFETLMYQGRAVTTLPSGAVTDSATAGTALATGYQHPANGVISMGAGNSIKTSILEMARARGLRTGIITTDSISGATPGRLGRMSPIGPTRPRSAPIIFWTTRPMGMPQAGPMFCSEAVTTIPP